MASSPEKGISQSPTKAFKTAGNDVSGGKFIPTCKICGRKHWPLDPSCIGKEGVKAEAKAKAQAEKRARARIKAEAKAKAKAEKVARAKTKAEVKVRAEAEKDVKAKIIAKAQEKTEAEKRARAKVKAEAKAKAKADKIAKAEKVARAKTKAEAKARLKIEKRAKVKTKAEERAKAISGAEAKARTKEKVVNLILFNKDGWQKSFLLSGGVTVIGRGDDCDVSIPIKSVSRKHCQLNCDKGSVKIRDLGSRNGTYVNGRAINEAVIKAGDSIRVGSSIFVLQIEGHPEKIALPDLAIQNLPQQDTSSWQATKEK